MPSYLEIALRVASTTQPMPSKPRRDACISTEGAGNQSQSSPVDMAARPQAQTNELAPCGSTHCAGCYDVGDGRKIHPPKIGEDYLKWLGSWKPRGNVQ